MGKAKRNRKTKRLKGKGEYLPFDIEPFCYTEGCYCYGFMADVMRHPDGEIARFLGIDRKVLPVKDV